MNKTIAIVGEAFGEEEERLGMPFVGKSGWFLDQCLNEAGIDRGKCHITNVFMTRPKPSNDIKNLCQEDKPVERLTYGQHVLPALDQKAWVRPEFYPHVRDLWDNLLRWQPNIVIALGNTAAWALLGQTKITKIRGTVTESLLGLKVLPTYHPAGVLRQYKNRPVLIADLMKAERQAQFPEVRRPKRELWIEPELAHIKLFYESYYVNASEVSLDIETAGNQITCIGFAVNERLALVIPFVDNRKPNGSYWETPELEREAWLWVRRMLDHPSIKIGQNGLYDLNWLWTVAGAPTHRYDEDTMLMHHAYMPELEKGLGFLGSVYTDEPAWKTMRTAGMFTTKRGS